MKRQKLFSSTMHILFLLVITLLVASFKTEKLRNQIEYKFKSGKYSIEKNKEGLAQINVEGVDQMIEKKINVEGFDQMLSPGDPILPLKVIEMAVPPNTDMKSIKLAYEVTTYNEIPEKLDIQPAPPSRARRDKEELFFWDHKPIYNHRNLKVYGVDTYYPSDPVSIRLKSQMRKWKFVRIAYYPFQYNPVQKKIRQAEEVTIYLKYKTIPIKIEILKEILNDTIMDGEARAKFINFSEASKWYSNNDQSNMSPPIAPGYVMIMTNKTVARLGSTLADFVKSKINLGYHVIQLTDSEYMHIHGQPPDQVPEKVRKWLSDNYLKQHIKYVLIIGNPDPDDQESYKNTDCDITMEQCCPNHTVGDIPMKQCWPNREDTCDREYPTDYYYANLTGNWDLDGDGYFGEITPVNKEASPDSSINPTTFSVRWTGKINVEYPGGYKFYENSNDGLSITIDGNTVINDLTPHYSSYKTGSIKLTPGLHDIEIKYFNLDKDAFINLMWSKPNDIDYNVILPEYLYYFHNGNYVAGGLDGEYFDNEDFTNLIFKRVDPYIYFYYGPGDKGDGGVDFTPDVYVGRIPLYNEDFKSTKAILEKIINFENANPTPDWRKKVLLPMHFMDDYTPSYDLGEYIKKDAAIPRGYQYFRIYTDTYGLRTPPEATPCTFETVANNWDGYGLVTWMTHGPSPTEASEVFLSSKCDSLDNSKPSFTFQASCNNGCPEASDNIGFSLLQHGAIGTVSASRISIYYIECWALPESWYLPTSWDLHGSLYLGGGKKSLLFPSPSAGYNKDLAYYFSKRLMEGQPIGKALYQTKSVSEHWTNNMAYNIYGDPSSCLESLPDLTVVSKSWSISLGQYLIINLTVKNIGTAGCGKSFCYINAIEPIPPSGVNAIRTQLIEDIPPLAKNQEFSFSKWVELSKIRNDDIKSIEVLIDAQDNVKESDENNNKETWNWNEGI